MKRLLTTILTVAMLMSTALTIPVAAESTAVTAQVSNQPAPVLYEWGGYYTVSGNNDKYTVMFNETANVKEVYVQHPYEAGIEVYYRLKGKTKWMQAEFGAVPVKKGCTYEICYGTESNKSEILTVTMKEKAMCKDNIATTAVTKAFTYRMENLSGHKVYYTLNGKKPTTKSKQLTSSGIKITKNCTLRLLVTRKGYVSQYLYYKIDINESNKYAEKSGLLNLAGTYTKEGAGLCRDRTSTGELYYTLDGTKPTEASAKATNLVGFTGELVKKSTTVRFLYVEENGAKHYFKQTYIIKSNVGNAQTSKAVAGLGGG